MSHAGVCVVVISLRSHYCFVRMCTRLSLCETLCALCPMLQATFISLFGSSSFAFISCSSHLLFPVLKIIFLFLYMTLFGSILLNFFIFFFLSRSNWPCWYGEAACLSLAWGWGLCVLMGIKTQARVETLYDYMTSDSFYFLPSNGKQQMPRFF